MFERPPRQSSAAGLIVTTKGQKQTRETFATGLNLQDRRRALAPRPNTGGIERGPNTGRGRLAAILTTNTQYRWLSFTEYYLFYIGGGKPFLFLFRPAAGFLYLLPIRFWNEEKTLTTYSFGESLTSCCPCCPTRAVYQRTTLRRYNIFLYCNTFLYFFSTIIHKFRFLYHISENEQNKDKIGTIPIRARVPLYSKIENRRQRAHNPKIYKLLYKIGLVLKWIKICTYPEEQALDSEKAHKKVQNRKIAERGFFGARNFQR